jgi:tetratricopeptide (TPR) repeat protein
MNKKTQWKKVFSSWKREEPACTLSLARAFLAEWPNHSPAWIVLGDNLTSLSRYADARQALLKAIRFCPPERLAYAYANMGHLYQEKGSYRIAERWYRKALSVDPKYSPNLVFLGACLAKQGRYAEAKRYHRRAIKSPSHPPDEAYFNLGLILRAEEKHDDALECFKEALKIDPKYTVAKQAMQDLEKLKKLEQTTTGSVVRGKPRR